MLNPLTERDHLLNRIYECNYVIPGAEDLELSQLKDLTEYVEYRVAQEKMQRIMDGAALASQLPPETVKAALREYLSWRKRKKGQG